MAVNEDNHPDDADELSGEASGNPYEAFRQFRRAEEALRQFIKANEAAASAEQAHKQATETMGEARKDVADASSGVFRLTGELSEIARDLAEGARILRRSDPEPLHKEMAQVGEKQGEMRSAVDARLSALEKSDKTIKRWLMGASALMLATAVLVVIVLVTG